MHRLLQNDQLACSDFSISCCFHQFGTEIATGTVQSLAGARLIGQKRMVLVFQNRVTQFRKVNTFSRFEFLIFLKTVFVNHKLLFQLLNFSVLLKSIKFDGNIPEELVV